MPGFTNGGSVEVSYRRVVSDSVAYVATMTADTHSGCRVELTFDQDAINSVERIIEAEAHPFSTTPMYAVVVINNRAYRRFSLQEIAEATAPHRVVVATDLGFEEAAALLEALNQAPTPRARR